MVVWVTSDRAAFGASSGTSAMKAAAYFSSDSVGTGSVNVLLDLIAGKDVAKETAVDAIEVTPENYKDVMGAAAE